MKWRIAITFGLWVVGLTPLFWWNGQHFTNRIIFLVFYAVSLALWLPILARRGPRSTRVIATALVVVNLAIVLWGLLGLPDALEAQRRFNQGFSQLN